MRKERYTEYKQRNYLTAEYIKTRNSKNGDIKFGAVADAADYLNEAETRWLIGQRVDADETIGSVLGRCALHAYHLHNMPDHIHDWVQGQADNINVSFAELVIAILEDVYSEDMGNE